jgi:pyridoxamine 5'-phosphate oxidase family protein
MIFRDDELAYLRSQRLGRLATVAPDGSLQNNPVGFRVDERAGTIEIGGWNLGRSRKFHNIRVNPQVALVVDDIASTDPWKVRGVQIRGTAEALSDQPPGGANMSIEVIRLHPRWVSSWGLAGDAMKGSRRRITDNSN